MTALRNKIEAATGLPRRGEVSEGRLPIRGVWELSKWSHQPLLFGTCTLDLGRKTQLF